MVTRTTFTRLAKRRATPRRGMTFVERERRRSEDRNFINSLMPQIKDSLSAASNIRNLNTIGQDIINRNINTIDPRLRPQFSGLVHQQIQILKQNQSTQITDLSRQTAGLQTRLNKKKRQLKDAERGTREREILSVTRKELQSQIEAANKIKLRLQSGERLDQGSIITFIKTTGIQTRQKEKRE